jgi:hypothetical protein
MDFGGSLPNSLSGKIQARSPNCLSSPGLGVLHDIFGGELQGILGLAALDSERAVAICYLRTM